MPLGAPHPAPAADGNDCSPEKSPTRIVRNRPITPDMKTATATPRAQLLGRGPCHGPAGFSLVELAMVLVIFGLIIGIAVPRYGVFMATQRLVGSTQNLAAEVRIARERAMSLGVDQPLHFYEDTWNCDFHVHTGAGITSTWSFPPGVHYATGSTIAITMLKDGSASPSGKVVLQDTRGRRDTLSILASGIVLIR